ncbi:MAG TPA: hypothetical protein VI299_03350 [Polyangiales bacterium]
MLLDLRDLDALHGALPALLDRYRAALGARRFADALEALDQGLQILDDALGQTPPATLCARPGSDPLLEGWLLGMQARACLLISTGQAQAGRSALRALLALDPADRTRTRLLLHVLGPELPERDEDGARARRPRAGASRSRRDAGTSSARHRREAKSFLLP